MLSNISFNHCTCSLIGHIHLKELEVELRVGPNGVNQIEIITCEDVIEFIKHHRVSN